MSNPRTPGPRFSRRAVVGSGLAGAAILPLAGLGGGVSGAGRTAAAPARQDPAAELAAWKTWLLTSPSELRPPDPGAVTASEIDEVVGFQAAPTEEMAAAIAAWGNPVATVPWMGIAGGALGEFGVTGMGATRYDALLFTAIHDAAVAAWDAQLAIGRESPAAADARIVAPAGIDPAAPTFPSIPAAVAGAATTVLAYLYPDAEEGRFADMAEQAAMAGVWAGAAFPSDAEAGLALGRAVGERAVARGRSDGADAVFDPADRPTGPGFWEPTPPAFRDPLAPLGGAMTPWVMERGDQFRPAPPPEYDSPAWRSELVALQEILRTRTLSQKADATWWQMAADPSVWTAELIARHGLDTPHAARVLAYQAVSIADAIIAVWDAKYTWWTARPITVDPDIETAFPTPPYPDYPSGYSAVMGALSQSVGLFFPDAAEQLDELAWRLTRSRAWAGIHFPYVNEVGLCMGRRVARLAMMRAAEEGAIPA